ncbi:hypothetical protein [Amycolatopsis sulphurea]|uniref:hypothetical protein n=1 Tax=Amycolatopsis sulphurea TaxID=76022 RepID=UPI000BF843C3|nr:hypothetical protein [Amycolatopsis sulphurea]
MSMPLLKIDADRAVSIGYHTNDLHTDSGAKLSRLTASQWAWRRQESGEWKAVRRTHRLIDGRESVRDLLRESLRAITRNS